MTRHITAHVKTKARRNAVMLLSDDEYRVETTAVPQDGKANVAVIALLAEYLGLHKNQLLIDRGATSTTKSISIT